ncbi:MAG: efflux RND transporter permease subunit [Pirellulales bacterium]|nr:efflux RND transporter permease subunit [Pirellulales bacterium]
MNGDRQPDFVGRAIDGVIRFCLENKLIVLLILAATVGWGLMVMPFDYDVGWLPRDPVPVDAIPDIGENQQIVFTEWMGRSPQDVEDQVTYPLTVSLLGVPGIKTVRSYSFLGFSSIYVVFEEDVEFYWSRSRILERLSVAQKDLPEGVTPALGPDATALGQIFWYTLEGRDPQTGEPAGGWDLDELRSIQDWDVRYALQSAGGVSEVASVGGFVREYQVDVDPDAMRAYRVTLADVYNAVRQSNIDVGARTIEVNHAEYVIRGLGFLRRVEDLANTVVKSNDNVPVYVGNVAHVTTGPAVRRGALDKGGAEAVGGVVVVRHGENPLQAIKNVKAKIDQLAPGLPSKTLPDGRVSQVSVVPFYDRTQLIHETLGTLENALSEEIMVTIIVVLVMVMHLRSSVLISALLPLAVLMAFIAMKVFRIDSNIMSLSGIAIAIGTMVDMGVILCENMLRHLDEAEPGESRREVIFRAASEVGRPVLTAILTTVISFLPIFVMIGPEGKLFKPLAFTKTFALVASVIVALTLIPPLAHMLFTLRRKRRWPRFVWAQMIIATGIIAGWYLSGWVAVALVLWGVYLNARDFVPESWARWAPRAANALAVVVVLLILTQHWMPLGPEKGMTRNLVFIATSMAALLGLFLLFRRFYEPLLRFFLAHKIAFYALPAACVLLGLTAWLGFNTVFGFLPAATARLGIAEKHVRGNAVWTWAAHEFPGLGREFMPELDEGSFLLMPTTMPHASIGEVLDVLRKQDMAISALPEVESAVGKLGRADSPLDPAPISMIETVINYKSEYVVDDNGRRLRFRFDPAGTDYARDAQGTLSPAPDGAPYTVAGRYARDPETGALIPDSDGTPYRNWRPALDPRLNPGRKSWPGIRSPDDIWKAIEQAARIVGTTGAPKLQPIAARIVMLQTGVRAPMAVRILGRKLEDIEQVAVAVQELLKEVPGVNPATVSADQIVGKPYLEIDIDRQAIARYGVAVRQVQDVIETAIGGRRVTTTVEGRQRYPVRVRYPRELRDSIESLGRILVAAADGSQIPLGQLAKIDYARGPQAIKSENTRLVGYVIFDKQDGHAEVDVVEACRAYLDRKWAEGELRLPPGTERPAFIGSYENQIRSAKTLAVVLPLALFLVFLVLYLQFRSVSTTMLVFAGVFIACSGGFILLWLYSTSWFGDVWVFGVHLRELFQIRPLNLSVAVWVGFIALLGIATDDGVVVASYLDQSFQRHRPTTPEEIREATVQAGLRRIRPCLMTTATTILALIPVLTSTGRGADVMVPMAVPSFGGMLIELITLFFVPVSYCLIQEIRLRIGLRAEGASA